MIHKFRAYRACFFLLRLPSPAAYLRWVVGCALLLCAAHASAGQVNLAWDAVSAPGLAGYRLYYGQTSGTDTTHLDVGLETTATVTGLTAGQTYYFVVTAHDTAGNESDASNTVTMTISPDTPGLSADIPHPAGDLDGDGKADLVWWHTTTGAVAVWLMHGSTLAGGAVVGTVDLNWQIVGVGDVDGDTKADLVWRHTTTGAVAVWLMHGSTLASGTVVGTVEDLHWQIQ